MAHGWQRWSSSVAMVSRRRCDAACKCLSTGRPREPPPLYGGSDELVATRPRISHWSPNVFRITSQGKSNAASFAHKLSSGARLSSAMEMM